MIKREHTTRLETLIMRGWASSRLVGAIVVIWLIIGLFAAGQRHYYSGGAQSCAKASTIAVTVIAGPHNYLGANPKVSCHVPQPSK
jgi:hypothetical protein